MEWWLIFEKGIWFGLASLGFAILFNVPPRTLFLIGVLALIGGMTRVIMLHFGINIILGSFAGATIIGFLSVMASHIKHAPPLVFSIPAVIPMVPGTLAYRTMLGFIKLASDHVNTPLSQMLSETTSNGLKMAFILLTLAVAVSVPMLISRKETFKYFRFGKKDKPNFD
jgi:uncharacterized membrane protein YjjB (DUF3815 family)